MSRSAHSLARAVFVIVCGLAHSIAFACVATLLFIVERVPASAAYAWRMVVTIGLAAFRRIGQLKPEYRASYNTHGLSLSGPFPNC